PLPPTLLQNHPPSTRSGASRPLFPPRPTDARRRGHGRRGAAFAQVARVEVTRRHRSRAPWRRPGGWKWETGGSESQVTPTSGDARRPPPRPGGGRWWQWGEVG